MKLNHILTNSAVVALAAMSLASAVSAQQARPIADPNIVQKAWSNPNANMGANQLSPGYSRHDFLADKIIPLTMREAMTTTIRFPADELIEDLYVSDPVSFEALIPRSNVIIVRVIRPNTDGNIVAFGKSGRLYQFYVKGESTTSTKITDMMVDIMARGTPQNRNSFTPNMAGAPRAASASDLTVEADWLRRIGFRPENIVHDLAIKIPEDDSAGVVPERVFRDNQFTYIDYGANADALNEWPVASLVVQGVETPVNVRTAGPNGRMLVVEGVGDIVLRNGMKVVCIKRSASPMVPTAPVRRQVMATLDVPQGGRVSAVSMNTQPDKNIAAVAPPPVASPASKRRFMIDLGAGTPTSLQKDWLTLKAQHNAVLGNADFKLINVTTMVNGAMTPETRLRAGPFFGLADGVTACKTITADNRPCAVVSDQ